MPQVNASRESLSARRPYFSFSTNSETGIESGGAGSCGTHFGDLKTMLWSTVFDLSLLFLHLAINVEEIYQLESQQENGIARPVPESVKSRDSPRRCVGNVRMWGGIPKEENRVV